MSKAIYVGAPNPNLRNLPSGYTQLEYIQSSGTQYIDTGFKPNQDTRLVMKTYFLITGTNMFLFGSRTGTNSNSFCFNAYSTNVYRSHYNNGWLDFASSISYTEPFTIDKNKNVTTLDGTNSVTETYASFACPSGLVLFGVSNNGTVETLATARLYSCQIYDNGTLVRDFVPCINASGTVGLYDMVGETFYTNAGTGTFTAGAALVTGSVAHKVKKLYIGVSSGVGADYTPVEYIQSDGYQYIATGFTPNQNTRVVCDVEVMTLASANAPLFGSRIGPQDSAFSAWLSSTQFYSDFGNNYQFLSGNPLGRYIVDKNKNVVKFGSNTITLTSNTFTAPAEMLIGATYNTGTVYLPGANARFYSFKIYDNDVLVRDYVPCVSSSGVAGMYDKLSHAFYGNAGTGVFTAGAELPREVARKVKKAYIGVNGIARLFYSGNPFTSYSGTYTVTDVTANGVVCKLYTLTTSGTLVLNDNAEYWMCGGGASGTTMGHVGEWPDATTDSGYGGAGGYIATGTLSAGNHVVTIGAGGTPTTYQSGKGNAGAATKVGSASVSGGGASDISSNLTSNGYSGGGGGVYAYITQYIDGTTGDWNSGLTKSGTGTGDSTLAYPFGLTSLYAHSAGGGGGGANPAGGMPCNGGAGGSAGANGAQGKNYGYNSGTTGKGGAGGTRGGGAGGEAGQYSSNSTQVKGSAATFYGSGGGGGAFYFDSEYSYYGTGGAGYQGVVYLLIPA